MKINNEESFCNISNWRDTICKKAFILNVVMEIYINVNKCTYSIKFRKAQKVLNIFFSKELYIITEMFALKYLMQSN